MGVVNCYFSVRERAGHFYIINSVEVENENFEFYEYQTKEKLSESEAEKISNELHRQYHCGNLKVNLEDKKMWNYLYSD